jgi:hypothetical protein
MKNSTILTACILLLSPMAIARAGEKTVGVVSIYLDSNNNVRSIATSIAVGKNAAAGTATISGTEAATSAIAGGGTLTVTGSGIGVGYSLGSESATSLQTPSTGTTTLPVETVRSTDTNLTKTVVNN